MVANHLFSVLRTTVPANLSFSSIGKEYSFSETRTESTSHFESHKMIWKGGGSVEPGGYATFELIYYKGNYDVGYTAYITLVGQSGSTYPLTRSGVMRGVSEGIAHIIRTDIPPDALDDVLLWEPVHEQLDDDKLPPKTKE